MVTLLACFNTFALYINTYRPRSRRSLSTDSSVCDLPPVWDSRISEVYIQRYYCMVIFEITSHNIRFRILWFLFLLLAVYYYSI